jgi:hypothetical protein
MVKVIATRRLYASSTGKCLKRYHKLDQISDGGIIEDCLRVEKRDIDPYLSLPWHSLDRYDHLICRNDGC